MSDWKLPWNASCLCGQVKMRITQAPIVSMACHCRGCQKLTGGAYSLSLMISAEGFEVLEGELEQGGLHRRESVHDFCAKCKNWLLTRIRDGRLVNLRVAMLDDPSWITPYFECYVSEKLPGAVSGAKIAFEQFPPPEQYPALMEAFARDGAKP